MIRNKTVFRNILMTSFAQNRLIDRELCESKWELREIVVKTLRKSERDNGQIKRNILKEAIYKFELRNTMKYHVFYTEFVYKNMGENSCKLPSSLRIR